jgi:hypothetical protein
MKMSEKATIKLNQPKISTQMIFKIDILCITHIPLKVSKDEQGTYK